MGGRMGCCDGVRAGAAKAASSLGYGVRGLSKAVTFSDRPPVEVIVERARACFGDPGRGPPCDRLGWGLVCRECGCLAAAKIRVGSEECPLGKWRASAAARSSADRRVDVRWGESREPLRPPDG